MRLKFPVQCLAAVVIPLAGAGNLFAIIVASPASVQETPAPGGRTQYGVSNNSNAGTPGGAFDIALVAVSTNGNTPTTTNTGWTSESLNAAEWALPMGAATGGLPTWQQYTGLTFTQAFPGQPVKVNGYFLNYAFDSMSNTISYPGGPAYPGTMIYPSQPVFGGFFFQGSPNSTFLVAGPADGTTSFTAGNAVKFSGTSSDLPEPVSAGSLALAAMVLLGRRRRIELKKES